MEPHIKFTYNLKNLRDTICFLHKSNSVYIHFMSNVLVWMPYYSIFSSVIAFQVYIICIVILECAFVLFMSIFDCCVGFSFFLFADIVVHIDIDFVSLSMMHRWHISGHFSSIVGISNIILSLIHKRCCDFCSCCMYQWERHTKCIGSIDCFEIQRKLFLRCRWINS